MRNKALFIVLFIAGFMLNGISAQMLDIGIFNNPVGSNKIEVRVRPTAAVSGKTYNAGVFTIRSLTTNNVGLAVQSSPFGYTYAGLTGTSGSYTYFAYQFFAGVAQTPNWVSGEEVVVATLTFTSEASSTWFELVKTDSWTTANNADYYQLLNGQEVQNNLYQSTTGNIVLPVELLSFKAEKEEDKTAIQWEVTNEKDLTYYAVERSIDGSNFKTIDIQKPRAKNENEKVRYGFLDEKPDLGVNYYRLQLKDLNGQVTYSKTVSVDFGSKIKAKTYPNPFSTDLSVEIDIEKNIKGDVLIDLLDMTGKIVQTKKLVAQGRRVNFNLPTNDLVPGTYVIRMKNGNDTWQQKITKQ